MQAQLTLNTRSWNQAMAKYATATGKTAAQTVNRQTKNFAIQCITIQKEAERSAIQTLEQKSWWPKYIAKILSKRKQFSAMKRWVTGKTKSAKTVQRQMHYTREQAQKFSKSIIKRRLVAVRFLKVFFAALAKVATPFAKGGGSYSIGKSYRGFVPQITPATDTKPETLWSVKYDSARRSDKTMMKAMRLLQQTIDAAIPVTIRDILNYANSENAKNAKAVSAK